MNLKEFTKLPNQITLLRIFLLPFLYYFAYIGNKIIFLILFLIAGLSDMFDGIIARALKQTSQFGAKFDSLADDLINFSIIIWLYLLLPAFIKENIVIILIALAFFITFTLLELIIHKKRLAMHLHSHKFTNVLLYLFILFSLFYQPSKLFLYILVTAIILAMVEGIIIILFFKEVPHDAVSIFSQVGKNRSK